MTETADLASRFDEEIAAGLLRGDLVPGTASLGVADFLGIQFSSVEPGRVVAELDVHEQLLDPFGAAYGSVLASVVDHAFGGAVLPIVPRGTWPATLEFKVNYLAPTRLGVLRATGRVLSLTRKVAVVGVDCENCDRHVGTALGTVSLSSGTRRISVEGHGVVELSTRETQILARLCGGASTSEIAAALYIAPVTVRSHIAALVKKARVADRFELVERFGTVDALR